MTAAPVRPTLQSIPAACEARNDPGRVRKLGLVYTLGVLVSFLVLAVAVIGGVLWTNASKALSPANGL